MKTRKGWLIKRGKTFYACWKISGKKFCRTTGQTDRRNAETRLSEIMQPFLVEDEVRTLETVKARIEGAKAELAQIEDERNPPLPLLGAWVAYLKASNRPDSGDRTLDQYQAELTRFIGWLHGRNLAQGRTAMPAHHPDVKAMQDVADKHAAEYAANLLASDASPSTFNQHISFLRLLWKVLAKPAKVTSNPWMNIELRRMKTQSRRELTTDELRRVCQAAEGEMRVLFALGIYTGLRRSDCATLQWGEVDIRRGRITRIPNKTARRKNTPVMVPIHPVLKDILNETPPHKRTGDVLPKLAKLYRNTPDRLNILIQSHFENCGLRTVKPGTGFDIVKGKDGKSDKKHTGKRGVVEVGFHSLRHTFVSLCREANAPLAVVEAIVGHSNPAMTRHYTHVSEQAAMLAVAALPSIMGEATPVKALPPADPLARVRAGLKAMTAKTWERIRDELLKEVQIP